MLEVYTQVSDLQEVLHKEKASVKSVGFVPTMGALHAGHVSLLERSRQENDITVCSIFVNPTQFNDARDYALYPRTELKDEQILERAGCNILFLPSEKEVYPTPEFRKIDFDPGKLGMRLEGKFRPGHFAGMTAVVKRLFDIVGPDKAYFGQKDYQQYLIVKKMIEHYQMPLQLVMCPIYREPNGLAMSSRNERLSPELRQHAALIYKILQQAVAELKTGLDFKTIQRNALASFDQDRNFQVEYFDICSANDLSPLAEHRAGEDVLICTAVMIGGVRLIDNVLAV